MTLEHALAAAVIVALFGTPMGSRTAWPLIGGALFHFAACWQGWQFYPALWVAVDLIAVVWIAWPLWPIVRARAWAWLLAFRRELAILALFAPMWAAYALPDGPRYVLSMTASIAQLLVSFPLVRFWEGWKATMRRHEEWTRFDPKVLA